MYERDPVNVCCESCELHESASSDDKHARTMKRRRPRSVEEPARKRKRRKGEQEELEAELDELARDAGSLPPARHTRSRRLRRRAT